MYKLLILTISLTTTLSFSSTAQDDINNPPDASGSTQDGCLNEGSLFDCSLHPENCGDNKSGFRTFHPTNSLVESINESPSSLLGDLEDDNYTLEFSRVTESSSHEDRLFTFYQQYYKNVKIAGGGVTVVHERANWGPDGPEPYDPCDNIISFRPYMVGGINVSDPEGLKLTNDEILGILDNQSVIEDSFIEFIDLSDGCELSLIQKVNYRLNGNSKLAIIKLDDDSIIYDANDILHKNAPTVTMGDQDLDDTDDGGTTSLASSDGRVFTYDFNQLISSTDFWAEDFAPNLIPFSPSAVLWDASHADLSAYQAHFLVGEAVGFFDDLGIEFQRVHVGTNATGANAGALRDSRPAGDTWITFGTSGGTTTAVMSVVGHEMGHAVVNQFLPYVGTAASLHEGLSDMFGAYMESLLTGNANWVMGSGNGSYVPLVDRNLQHPNTDCFNDVANLVFNSRHDRSVPLGHWFYTLAEEGEGTIPMESILRILIDALSGRPADDFRTDYRDLMEATMDVVLQDFGFCSKEYVAFSNAWNEICIPTGFPVTDQETFCDLVLTGPSNFCEESPYQSFCVQTGLATTRYRFYILGRDNTDFESSCGMNGNSQEVSGCSCLSLTQLPDFPFYPQKIKIVVYNLTHGPEYKVEQTVTIYDCDGDDLTCYEYYNQDNGLIAPESTLPSAMTTAIHTSDLLEINLGADVVTYLSNPSGQVLYEGKATGVRNFYRYLPAGIYFLTVVNEQTNEVTTQLLYHD